MNHSDHIYKRFIKIILPICITAFVLTIGTFELLNYQKERQSLLDKLDRLSATYSLLYAEPIARQDNELLKSYSVSLISDKEIALLRIEDTEGNVLEEFSSGAKIKDPFKRELSINYATENSLQRVGKFTLAGCTSQINASLIARIRYELVTLIVLISSVLLSVWIAFKRSVHTSITQLSHEATHDPLTDLINRRAFEDVLIASSQHRRTTDQHHALLYLDLDGFKHINDANGHLAGDDVLKQVAHILVRHTRKGDTIARLGGDEFGILLRDCDTDTAISISEKIRSAIDHQEFEWEELTFNIGVSIGIASIDNPNIGVEDCINMADEACYAAKRQGRNCVQIYGEIKQAC